MNLIVTELISDVGSSVETHTSMSPGCEPLL
jgi:hypothetical protein